MNNRLQYMSQLLHNDCQRMLQQPINKIIVSEVLEKLSQIEKKHIIFVGVPNTKAKEKNNLYKLVLTIFGCDKY